MRQELRQGRRVTTRLAPRLTFTGLHQRFREGNGTRCPEHPRPPAFLSKCSEMSQQCWHLPCLASASCQRKSAASSLQRPPVSMATTTSRHRLEVRSSGYVASLSRRACANTAPSSSAAPGWASPEALRALRKVLSTANWVPLKQGRSCARTSMRLSSSPRTPKLQRFQSWNLHAVNEHGWQIHRSGT